MRRAALALLAGVLAWSAAAQPGALDGRLSVSIASPSLKHWGVPGGEAAFVPDSDHGALAQAIREASSSDALCTALERAAADTAIATAPVDGDGNLEHRSGDQTFLTFHMVLSALSAPTAGIVCACSDPIVAMLSRGSYPEERFQPAGEHRLSWNCRRLMLRPSEHASVLLTATVDASAW